MEQIKLTDELLKRIKKEIDQNTNKDKKAVGFSQLTLWFSTQHITKGQAQQIITFYNHYDNNDPKDRDRKEIYDRLVILPFAKNSIEHLKRIEATKRKTVQHTRTNRTVDRMNTINTTSTKPPQAPRTADIKVDGLNEELKRFSMLTNYDLSEGLTMKQFRVTYTVGKGARVTTTIGAYSGSELHIIARLKERNPSLRGKEIIVLDIQKK
jgi:hypothetical protein